MFPIATSRGSAEYRLVEVSWDEGVGIMKDFDISRVLLYFYVRTTRMRCQENEPGHRKSRASGQICNIAQIGQVDLEESPVFRDAMQDIEDIDIKIFRDLAHVAYVSHT